MRFKKLKGTSRVLAAARHNLRELPLTPNITAGKQEANQVVWGGLTSNAVNEAYKAMLIAAGVRKLRVDAVRLIECVISLPVGCHDADGKYFTAAIAWLRQKFGQENILSAIVHNDESAQHMHVLVVPLVDGHMRGSDLLGGPHHIGALLRSFEQAIQPAWKQLGFDTEHSVPPDQMARETVAYLQRIRDPMWESAVAPIIRAFIEDNPEPFFQMLGCPTTAPAVTGIDEDSCLPPRVKRFRRAKRQSTMAEIFTRPVRNMRGASAERYRQSTEYLQAHRVLPLLCKVSAVAQSAAVATRDPKAGLSLSTVEAAVVASDIPTRTLCSVGFALQKPSPQRAQVQKERDASQVSAGAPFRTSAAHALQQQPIFQLVRRARPEATDTAHNIGCHDQAPQQRQVHRAWRWPPTRAPCKASLSRCQTAGPKCGGYGHQHPYGDLRCVDHANCPMHGCSVKVFEMTDDQKRGLLKAYYAATKEIFAAWRARGYPHPPPLRPDFPGALRGLTCGAKTRAGTACKQTALLNGGRCKLHGGCSTGPTSPDGKKTSSQNGMTRKTKRTP